RRVIHPLLGRRPREVRLLRPPEEGVGDRLEYAGRERHAVPAHPRAHHADRHRRARQGGRLLDRRAPPDHREGRLQAVGGGAMRMTNLFQRIRKRYRPLERRERGVAMLIVLTWLALMISLVGEFTYGTTVDAAQAANARDETRA